MSAIDFTKLSSYEPFLEATKRLTDEVQPATGILDEIEHGIVYLPNLKTPTPDIHIGQLKLLLSEINFCTMLPFDKPQYVVYAGAGPNHKALVYTMLFPKITWILVDPATFEISHFKNNKRTNHRKDFHPDIFTFAPNKRTASKFARMPPLNKLADTIKSMKQRLIVIEDFMTEDLAAALKPLKPAFISDIRTNTNPIPDGSPSEVDLAWNNAQHCVWINALRPTLWMLKFRPPFYDEESTKNFEARVKDMPAQARKDLARAKEIFNLDFIANYRASCTDFKFFKGVVHLQAFHGRKSSECRLIGKGMKIHTYNACKMENKLLWHVLINRHLVRHHNPLLESNPVFARKHSLCQCNDCALMVQYVISYVAMSNEHRAPHLRMSIEDVIGLCFQYTRPIRAKNHGLYGPIDQAYVDRILEHWDPES